ncbi:MAG: tetratricopeptide repeat protein [Cyclobacteriaceae bacterium]
MTKKFILLTHLAIFCVAHVYGQHIPITTRSERASAYYEQADSLENILENDKAKALYLKAVVEDSSFALAWMRAAMTVDDYADRKKYLAEAMKYLADVSEGERLWIAARNAFYGNGEEDEEFENFQQLQKLYPENARSNYLFGYANRHHGQSNDSMAVYYFKRAIKLNPKLAVAYNELCYAHLELKEYEEAKNAIEAYIKLIPNHPNPYDSYAEIFMRMGKHAQSIAAYQKVLELDPNYAWAYMGLAANYNYLSEFAKARRHLRICDTLALSDYQYRHMWKGTVVSYIEEDLIDSAVVTLRRQRQAVVDKIHHREPVFHLFYGYKRAVRLLFEAGNTIDGMNEYEQWLTFCKDSLKTTTYERIELLRPYYEAFGAYNQKDNALAIEILNMHAEAPGELTKEAKVLKARILLAQGESLEACEILEALPEMDVYEQSWYAAALIQVGEKEQGKKLLLNIIDMKELNNIDLALARQHVRRVLQAND